MIAGKLAGRIAAVTGASRGIGKAIAARLIAFGADVCLIGRRLSPLEEVAKSAGCSAEQVSCHQADLTKDEDVRQLTTAILHRWSGIDLLVHSAGTIHHGSFESAPVGDLDEQYRSNVRAPYLLTQMLLPVLKQRKGDIVFINSSIVLTAGAGAAQFSATQHALKAIADSLREEVNPDGVRVLSVYPGRTATLRQETLYRTAGRNYKPEVLLQPEDIAESVLSAVSLPRTAELTNLHIRPLLKSY
jgi:NADP-dependent 3-hydroxy acid dehydrogenase YdfG